ncbi:sensor histidine kinase [Paenibacillus nanensis]|uniref:histidine kinase n=1 Tax=Paenibacillus nanensis TaxID=393251 RepID=A0A3A1URI6_9BACL|nr:sensor histidine kinase [Paenibacillus nanensis]RIX49323.1 sensor histidine kinase [Paenibacillus nanensis]
MERKKRGITLIFKYALFVTIGVAACVMLTSLINGGLEKANLPIGQGVASEMPGVEIHVGALPVEAGIVRTEDASWLQPYEAAQLARTRAFEGEYWIRLPSSELPSRDPQLWIRGVDRYEVFLNGTSAFRFNIDSYNPRLSTQNQLRLLPLHDFRGSDVLIRIKQSSPGLDLLESSVVALPAEEVFSHIFRQNAVRALLGVLFLFLGAVSLLVFAANRKQLVYLYFALINISNGFGCVINAEFLNYYADTSALAYYSPLLLPFAMVAYLAFLEQIYGPGFRSLTTWLRRLTTVCLPCCAVLAWMNQDVYAWMTGELFQGLLIAVLIAASLSIVRVHRFQVDGKTEWVMLGNGIMILLWVQFWLLRLFPSIEKWMLAKLPLYAIYWQPEMMYVAGFIFVLCSGLALFGYLRDMQDQVHHYARQLKEQNRKLQELDELKDKETYRQLQASMMETYEALGEVAIWEERNRIAHEIHDILGHKLTGAAMQLEAAKRLLRIDPDTAQSKLEAALESVRKGLEDVRAAVRMMKERPSKDDLVILLNELINETEQMAGVIIERYIHPLPVLDAFVKKTVYHALQEGLTNGIKHGGSSLFFFTLRVEGDMLHFVLCNDGAPYTAVPYGFGLSAMKERIKHLGGSIELTSLDNRYGSVLKIDIPLKESA